MTRSALHLTRASALRLTLIALIAGCALAPAALATTQPPRASLTDIENDVMCTSCREPLAVAQSPQADSERAYIRGLIAQGLTKRQIEQNLVAQYGEAVLGKPPASGSRQDVHMTSFSMSVSDARGGCVAASAAGARAQPAIRAMSVRRSADWDMRLR